MFDQLPCDRTTRAALAAQVAAPAGHLLVLHGPGDLPFLAARALADGLVRPDARDHDVHVASPSGDRWSLDEVRDLVSGPAQLVSFDRCVVVVEHADAMDTACAEHLLKVVEEPGGNTMFVFCVPEPSSLLVTLRGRASAEIRTSPAPDRDRVRLLRDAGVPNPERLVAWCDGAAGVLVRLAADPSLEPLVARALGAGLDVTAPASSGYAVAEALEELARAVDPDATDDAATGDPKGAVGTPKTEKAAGRRKPAEQVVRARSRQLARVLLARWRRELATALRAADDAAAYAEVVARARALDELEAAIWRYRPLPAALTAAAARV
jgi:hypothetical protein